MNLLQVKTELPGLDPDIILAPFGWSISSSFLMIGLIILLLVIFSIALKKRLKLQPGGLQNATEMVYESALDLVSQITGDKKKANKIFPLVGALLIYLVLANLISLIPGLTSITYEGKSIFRSPTSDFNTTFGLALAMVVLINLISIRKQGFFSYLGGFFKFKELILSFRKGAGEVAIAFINFFIGLLDVISEFAKIISLSLRLFGNIFAGEVLAVIILGGLAYILPSAWTAMNILTGVVQALVFAALVAAYYSLATQDGVEE